MSTTIDCLVDTTPMAKTVGTVAHHVNGTTAAVTAMQAAVIGAEKEGADLVCTRVNQGFYSLIRSQISQKIAALQSQVDSHLMRLNQQRSQLTAIRQRMERDYNMISSRYLKLFTTINRNLSQRVSELDGPIMNLADQDASHVIRRASRLTADIPVGQSESVRVAQTVGVANLKFRALKAIESIHGFISGFARLENSTRAISLPNRTGMRFHHGDSTYTIPVAVSQGNFDSSGSLSTEVFLSRMEISPEARKAIETAVDDALRNDTLRWGEPCRPAPEVISAFHAMINDSGLDKRRREVMIKMFESSEIESFTNDSR